MVRCLLLSRIHLCFVSFEMVDSTRDLFFRRVDSWLGMHSFGRVLAYLAQSRRFDCQHLLNSMVVHTCNLIVQR